MPRAIGSRRMMARQRVLARWQLLAPANRLEFRCAMRRAKRSRRMVNVHFLRAFVCACDMPHGVIDRRNI